jgi:hypothetical protein
MWVTGSFTFTLDGFRFSASAWKPSNIQHWKCCLPFLCFMHMFW